MKIVDNMLITEVAGEYVVVPVEGLASEFQGIIRLNKTGKDIWEGLADGLGEDEIADKLLDKYEGVTMEEALDYIREIVKKLDNCGLIEK